jgi:hypothetical protein
MKCLVFVVGALLVSSSAFAQPQAHATTHKLTEADGARLMQLLQETSKRLDLLQARADVVIPRSSGISWIDQRIVVTEDDGPVLYVDGWGFTCDSHDPKAADLARVAVVVDGVETGDLVERLERPDAKEWSDSIAYCGPYGGGFVPTRIGARFRVPLRVFLMGDVREHTVMFRVYDIVGRAVNGTVERVPLDTAWRLDR